MFRVSEFEYLSVLIIYGLTKGVLYVTGKVYEKHRTKESGTAIPEDIRVDQLSDYQMQHLDRLKAWIYEQSVKVRQERGRAERRERKEAEAARREAERPVLFEF